MLREPVQDDLIREMMALKPSLIVFLVRKLPSREDAEDVMQELFAKLLNAKPVIPGNVKAYLFTAASNAAADWHRREYARSDQKALPIDDYDIEDERASPSQVLESRQRIERLKQALDKLPTDARQAFILHRIEGCTLDKTAEQLGVSTSRVRKLVDRALTRLTKYVWSD